MIKEKLKGIIETAIGSASSEGKLGQMTECSVPVTIEKPRLPEHGDLACGTALKLAGAARTAPIKIAETVAQYIEQNPKANHEFISRLNAAAPGFINFHLGTGWLKETL